MAEGYVAADEFDGVVAAIRFIGWGAIWRICKGVYTEYLHDSSEGTSPVS